MGTESFSKGLVEIISSSNESAKIEGEFLQVLQALNTNSEALDVFRNFGIPADKKIEAISNIFSKRVTSMTLDLVTLTISLIVFIISLLFIFFKGIACLLSG